MIKVDDAHSFLLADKKRLVSGCEPYLCFGEILYLVPAIDTYLVEGVLVF
jgi:hypothetical protein